MAQFSGQVFKLYTGRTASFRLENDSIYYNSRSALPAFVQPGAFIEFEAGELSRSGKGRDVVEGSIKLASKAASGGGAVSASSGSDGPRYQGALERAILMVDMLVRHGAVKLPENAAKRAGVLEALVDRFTASFFEDTGDLGALDRAEPVEVEAPAETPKKVKKVEVVEEDESEDLDD